jgi:MFS family permease
MGRAFVGLCLIYFLNSLLTAPFAALFPVYVEADLERPPWFTGNLRGFMLLLGGLFALVGGRLGDRLGLKTTLLIGLAGAALTGLVFRAQDTWVLALLIFVLGAAAGPWSTAGQSYLIGSVEAGRLGLGSALYFLSNTAGHSLGSLLTGLAKESWSFPRLGTAMSGGLLAVLVAAFLILPSGRTPAPATGLPTGSAYWPLLRRGEVGLLVGLRLGITTFWGMASLLLPLLIYRVGQSQSLPAYYAAISLAVAALCQVLTGQLCDRFGRFWPLLASVSLVALSALGLALFRDSLAGLFCLGTALTAAAWAVSTLIPKLISEVAAADEKNRLVGLGHLVWSLAMLMGSVLGGLLVELHAALPFLLGAALACGGLWCGWRLCARLDRKAPRA